MQCSVTPRLRSMLAINDGLNPITWEDRSLTIHFTLSLQELGSSFDVSYLWELIQNHSGKSVVGFGSRGENRPITRPGIEHFESFIPLLVLLTPTI